VGPRAGLDAVMKRKIPSPRPESMSRDSSEVWCWATGWMTGGSMHIEIC